MNVFQVRFQVVGEHNSLAFSGKIDDSTMILVFFGGNVLSLKLSSITPETSVNSV